MPIKERATSGARWTLSSSAAISVLNLVQLVILSRILLPDDFGLIAMAMVAVGLAQIFSDLGTSNAIIWRSDPSDRELSSIYWVNVIFSIGIAAIFMISSPLVATIFDDTRLTGLLLVFSLSFPLESIGRQFNIILQKNLFFGRLAFVESLSAAFGTVSAVLSAVSGLGAYSIAVGYITMLTVRSLLGIAFARSVWLPILRCRASDLKEVFSFSMYQMGERLVTHVTWNLDKLVIGRLLGATSLGYYSIAFQIILYPMSMLNPAVTKVAFPVFSTVQHDNGLLRQGYLKLTKILSFIILPVYAGIFAISGTLVPTLLGAGWDPVIVPLRILTWLGASFALGNPIGSILLAKGRADIGFWYNAAILPLFAFAVIIGSHWEATGVAMGMLLSSVSLFPVDIYIYRRLIGLRPLDYIGRIAPFLIISLAMCAAVMLADVLVQTLSGPVKIAALCLTGAVIYIGMAYAIDRPFMKEIASMATGKT